MEDGVGEEEIGKRPLGGDPLELALVLGVDLDPETNCTAERERAPSEHRRELWWEAQPAWGSPAQDGSLLYQGKFTPSLLQKSRNSDGAAMESVFPQHHTHHRVPRVLRRTSSEQDWTHRDVWIFLCPPLGVLETQNDLGWKGS